jgi:hypothetical protein
MTASLVGIELPQFASGWDPTDTTDYGWPNNRSAVSTTVSTTGAYWTQTDNDGVLGLASYAVPSTGVSATVAPVAYGTTSAACDGLGYANWPMPAACGFGACRATRFFIASRTISALKGTITNCNTITGDVIGPNPDSAVDPDTDGEMRADARIYDCLLSGGYGRCSDRNDLNSQPLENTLDGQPQTQQIDNASFVIKRVPAAMVNANREITCSNIRAMTFP